MIGHWKALARLALALFLTVVIAPAGSAKDAGPSIWELTATRVLVSVGFEPSCGVARRVQDDFVRTLAEQAEAVIGGVWQLHAERRPHVRIRKALDQANGQAEVSAQEVSPEIDKWLVLAVSRRLDRGLMRAREYDAHTRQWGPVASVELEQPQALAEHAFRLLLKVYRPLGRIEASDDGAIVRLRGGSLPTRDPSLAWTKPGQLFQVFVRFNRRDGTARAIRPIEWTFLEATRVENASLIACHVHTALRSPIRHRRRGRTESLALSVAEVPGTTRLRLRSRDKAERPLSGYAVYEAAVDGRAAELLGHTDADGAILIPAGPSPLRLLWVLGGGEPLAPRLPMVPGLLPEQTARLPDNSVRLEVGGFITGLQEELVDAVARRRILLAQARKRMEAEEFAGAERQLALLRRLPTKAEFSARLTSLEQRLPPLDEPNRRSVSRMIGDTRKLLDRFYDPRAERQLQSQLTKSRSASQPDNQEN